MLAFTEDPAAVQASAVAIGGLVSGRMRRMVVATINGVAAGETPLGRAMLEAGFAPSYKGLAART